MTLLDILFEIPSEDGYAQETGLAKDASSDDLIPDSSHFSTHTEETRPMVVVEVQETVGRISYRHGRAPLEETTRDANASRADQNLDSA